MENLLRQVIFATALTASFAQAAAEEASELTCEDVHSIENETEQCSFVKDNPACSTDGGYVNYAAALYCQFQGRLRPLGFVLYALWFLYLLLATAVTSDRFFAPNLPVIADALHLSENVAGETLLALGNGAPDFFTSLVSALNMKGGDAGILYGTLLGSGVFVTTVIVATIVMIRPFHTMQRPLLKDIAFYMCSVFCAFGTLWDGVIYLWEAIMFLVIYFTYLAFVVSGPYLNKFLINWAKKRRLAKANLEQSESPRTDQSTITSPTGDIFSHDDERMSVIVESPVYELQTLGGPTINAIVSAENGTVPSQQVASNRINKEQDEEEATPQSAAIHGIINSERVLFAFASGLTHETRTPPSALDRPKVAIIRQHSKSTGQWESQTRRGTVIGSQISPAAIKQGALRPVQRRMSVWASPRYRRPSMTASPASPLAVGSQSGSQSRRPSSRASPNFDQQQASPALPRSARLIMRRASVRLNEQLKMKQDNEEEQNQEEEDGETSVRPARRESRAQSRLEAFLEDDTDEETEQKEQALTVKRRQSTSYSRKLSTSPRNETENNTNGDIYVVPVPPMAPQEEASISDGDQTTSSPSFKKNRLRARAKSVWTGKQLRFADSPSSIPPSEPAGPLRVSIKEPPVTVVTPPDQDEERREEIEGVQETHDEHPVVETEKEGDDDFDMVQDRPYWKWILEGYNPIEMDEWPKQNWFGKLVQSLKAPIIFVMLITNPVLDEDKAMFNWNRPVNCLHCVISPVFVLLAIVQFDVMLGGKFPLIVLFAIIGLGFGAGVFFTSTNTKRPKYHLAFAALGFVTTVIWIYVLANEIVNLLQCFGLALNISQSILGLTCLAWGNSLGDLVNNIIIAKQGYSKMAISSCFGGMLFNLLLGLGVPLLIVTAKNGGIVHIAQSNVLTVLFGFLGLELVSSFIAIPIIQHFYVRRPFAIYLYAIYACCLVFAVLTEVGVISPNIFRYAYVEA